MGNTQSSRARCEMQSVARENLSLKLPSTEGKEKNYEDEFCPVSKQNDDQSNKQDILLIGEHENQISFCGEVDLHQHVTNCKKNPGHPEFIPIELIERLPEGHPDSDLYEFIKAAADLTVRLSVTMTSPDRPEFWPKTKTPYFLSELRGKTTLRTGTGRVFGIYKHTNKYKLSCIKVEDEESDTDEDELLSCRPTTCPCDKCKASVKPSKVWWEISVVTAAHVVVDAIEASHTTLRLFYDSEDSELVILKGNDKDISVNIENDMSIFNCATCDKKLVNKLEKMNKHLKDVWENVRRKYKQSRHIDKLMFIVSHPHGCSKKVSVGRWNRKEQVGREKYNHKFIYTTCTCPGSSGASVIFVGYNFSTYAGHVHSGSLKPGLNYSGAAEAV